MVQRQPITTFVCPALIGRQSYLAEAGPFLAGNGARVLVISGATGIGKSRLSEEMQRLALAADYQVLWGACSETARYFPYSPIIDLVNSLVAARGPGELIEHLGPLASGLAQILPDLAGDLPAPSPNSHLDGGEQRLRLFQALTRLFTSSSSRQPTLLVLEDVHWCDEASLEFLGYLTRRAGGHPLRLLLTYRTEDAHAGLSSFLISLERDLLCRESNLPPLSKSDTGAMVRAVLGPESAVRPSVMDVVHTLTEGNPFYIEEVLKSLVNSGQLFEAAGRWDWKLGDKITVPRSVSHAVNMRIGALSATAKDLALTAAVAGQNFDLELIRAVTGMPEAVLLDAIKELMATQLVTEESAEVFAFRHAITREAVYATLLAKERQPLHRLIGELLEARHPTPGRLGLIAYHFFEAGRWPAALDYSLKAGEHSLCLGAPNSAATHFTRAIQASVNLGSTPPKEALVGRSRAYQVLGDLPGAEADLEAARANMAGDAAAECEVLMDLGGLWAARDYHRAGEFFRQALQAAQTSEDKQLHARSLNRAGNWRLNVGQTKAALLAHEAALDIFQEIDDPQGTASTLDLLGMTNSISGDLARGARYYEQAIEFFRAENNQASLASALGTLPLRGLTYNGDACAPATTDLASCVQDGKSALEITRRLEWRSGEIYAMFNLAFSLGPTGEYGEALDYAWAALGNAEEIEHRQWMTAAHCVLGAIFHDLLDWEKARQHLEQGLVLAEETRSAYWTNVAAAALGATHIQQRSYTKAAETLDRPQPLADDMAPGRRQVEASRAELAVARGHAGQALSILDGLTGPAAENGFGDRILRLSKTRADALFALGRLPESAAELTAARDAAAVMGALPWQWRLDAGLGRVHQAMGQRAQARAEYDAAREVIERLAEKVPDQAVRTSFLRESAKLAPPATPPTPNRAAKAAFGGLTRRERDVARLLTRALTNRQIAEELVVTERTVESHVSNILAKLGLSSRAQAAIWAAEQDPGAE
ncbi:MAG: AAA family ATPase [Chloroflexi bacterium]|nr:AAA family ATPase [Chloroflexota bacterium]MDA1269660.1 AAA family ATPase [Chloroflexota bacterium]